jgi:hypothetical protein
MITRTVAWRCTPPSAMRGPGCKWRLVTRVLGLPPQAAPLGRSRQRLGPSGQRRGSTPAGPTSPVRAQRRESLLSDSTFARASELAVKSAKHLVIRGIMTENGGKAFYLKRSTLVRKRKLRVCGRCQRRMGFCRHIGSGSAALSRVSA